MHRTKTKGQTKLAVLKSLKSKAGFFLQAGAHKELRNAKGPQLQSKHSTKLTYASKLSQRGPPPTSRAARKRHARACTLENGQFCKFLNTLEPSQHQ